MDCPLLSVDIETMGNEKASAYFSDLEVDAPKNYKNEEAIEKYKEERLKKLTSQAGLKWWLGKIVCISWVDVETLKHGVLFGVNEAQLLGHFFNVLVKEYPKHGLIGKNFKNFDYGFFVGRALANRIPLAHHFHFKRRGLVYDLESLFHFSSQSSHHGKLQDYAHGYGISAKSGGMDGSKIQRMMETYLLSSGEQEKKDIAKKISDYCLEDSMVVAMMAKQYQKAFVVNESLEDIPF